MKLQFLHHLHLAQFEALIRRFPKISFRHVRIQLVRVVTVFHRSHLLPWSDRLYMSLKYDIDFPNVITNKISLELIIQSYQS